jgi:ubiquinone/menaquinone biosynthesis C-methylase UbiE
MDKAYQSAAQADDPRREYFNALAEEWDDEEPSAESMALRLDQHARLFKLKPGNDLLEAGCGTGKTTGWLAEQVEPGRVTAVDFAMQMIECARSKGIYADFTCLDLVTDDLGRERFDVVFCFHAFPHFRDQPAVLANFSRALRPNGRLLVVHLASSERINAFHAGVEGPVNGDLLPAGDEWEGLLAAAGLKLVKQIDTDELFLVEASKS